VHLITSDDDDLYGLASAAGKLGRTTKLLARLASDRQADPASAEAASRYALALMAMLPSAGNSLAAHARFTVTIDALGDVLDLDPDHWLARYSRARLRTLTPSSYGSHAVQLESELAAARADVDHLLGWQRLHAGPPYFVSTHALAAMIDYLAGGPAPGGNGERPGQAALRAALAACLRVPVRLPALGAVLCEPLVTLHGVTAGAERAEIGAVMSALYGDQPVVKAATAVSATASAVVRAL
jgi:hypothetical protein